MRSWVGHPVVDHVAVGEEPISRVRPPILVISGVGRAFGDVPSHQSPALRRLTRGLGAEIEHIVDDPSDATIDLPETLIGKDQYSQSMVRHVRPPDRCPSSFARMR
jgi:hypothetical protein